MKTKHTAGPWMFENGDYPNQCLIGSDGTHIADRIPHTHNEEANAGLIAAAPELLAACLKMVEAWECRCPEAGIVAIQDAIQKATGEA
jgi:hypothetical protein